MRTIGIISFFTGVFFIIFFIALLVVGDVAYGLLLVGISCWALALFLIKGQSKARAQSLSKRGQP